MFKCICGIKRSLRSEMESHMRNCISVKRKIEFSSGSVESISNIVISNLMFDNCCSSVSDNTSSDSFSSGGGSFDGGGSSSDY